MNQSKGSSPFGKLPLNESDQKKSNSVAQDLVGKIDSKAIMNENRKVKGRPTKVERLTATQIYFSGEVRAELQRLKKEERMNISGLVDRVMREYLETLK